MDSFVVRCVGAGFDLLNGTYTRLGRVVEGGGSAVHFEQTWFAHRVFRSVLAMRLTLTYVPGPSRCLVSIHTGDVDDWGLTGDMTVMFVSGADSLPVTVVLNTKRGDAPSQDVDLRDISDGHPGKKVGLPGPGAAGWAGRRRDPPLLLGLSRCAAG